MKDRIQLSDHFTYQRLIRFVLPSIGMMIFTSIYGAVDGLFVSNFAGKSALAAVNLIMPFPMLLGVLGFMIGTGGNVIIAKTLGEGEHKKANEYFSMLIYVTMAGGVIFTVLVLPMFLLIDGVWAAIAVSEVLALVVTFFFFAKEKKSNYIWYALVLVLFVLVIWMVWGNKALERNTFVISSERIPESFDGFRIVHLSDLHNEEFGEENSRLLEMITECDPDIIVITGDLVDSDRTDIGVALRFAERAVEIAPIYYVTGNHEYVMEGYEELESGLVNAGVTVLRDETVVLEREGSSICLSGFDDPCFGGTDYQARLDALKDVHNRYTIWLSHRPELFYVYTQNQLDLVLSGHAHGGQFRLPLVGGLVAPGQGFFPKYDAGLYSEGNAKMIVSRGIGNSLIPMRFNNRPEVIEVILRSDSTG